MQPEVIVVPHDTYSKVFVKFAGKSCSNTSHSEMLEKFGLSYWYGSPKGVWLIVRDEKLMLKSRLQYGY